MKSFDLDKLVKLEGGEVFSTPSFTRMKKEYNSVNITADKAEYPAISGHYFLSADAEEIEFGFSSAEFRYSEEVGYIFHGEKEIFIIPESPVLRSYDENGRIVQESEPDEFEVDSSGLRVFIGDSTGRIEFPMLIIQDESMLDLTPVEKKNYAASPREHMHRLKDFWRSFVKFYTYSPEFKQPFLKDESCKFRYESGSLGWYKIFQHLYKETDKDIYRFFMEELAHSVLETLEEGRWTHGSWTDEMETHTRYQGDGIFLLMDFYDRGYGSEKFLESAEEAAGYLVELSDNLDCGRWFVHDSLEKGEELHEFYSESITTTHFGKRRTNSLTLNTHISTLVALKSVIESGRGNFRQEYEEGIQALEYVIDRRPLEPVYRFFMKFYSPERKGTFAQFVNRAAASVVRQLKRVSPRLVMPGGFVDRDLDRSYLNKSYHVLNLDDLYTMTEIEDRLDFNNEIYRGLSYIREHDYLSERASGDEIFLLRVISRILAETESSVESSCGNRQLVVNSESNTSLEYLLSKVEKVRPGTS